MKLGELLRRHTWGEIRSVLLREYPDQEKSIAGYEDAVSILLALDPVFSEMMIHVGWVTDDFDGLRYVRVDGMMLGDELSYALEFTDWAKWLSMEVSASSFAEFGEVDILAHCLWEMTFVGYTPEEVKVRDEALIVAYEDALAQLVKEKT